MLGFPNIHPRRISLRRPQNARTCDKRATNLSSDGNLNLNTGLDVDDDLLDDLGRGSQTAIWVSTTAPRLKHWKKERRTR